MKTVKEYAEELGRAREKLIRDGLYTPKSANDLFEETLKTAMKDVEEETIRRVTAKVGTSETIGKEVK